MKKMFVTLAAVCLVSLFVTAAMAATDSRPVLGIKAFENPPNYYNSTVGNGLTDLFTTELQKTGKYKIIERAQIGEITDEVDFGKSGYVDQKTAVKKGHILGVQYYFLAKVTNFGAEQKKTGGSGWGGGVFGGLGVKKDKANVRIDFRIVDATSGEVVYADYGEGNYSKSGASFGGGAWGHGGGDLDLSSSEFLDSMVGKATLLSINDIMQKMDHGFLETHTSRSQELAQEESVAQQDAVAALRKVPGKILAVVSNDMIIVNLGSGNGIRAGDRFAIMKNTDIKNSKGEIVYSEEKEVGALEVFEAQADRSKCRLVSGTDAKEGYTVKLQGQ